MSLTSPLSLSFTSRGVKGGFPLTKCYDWVSHAPPGAASTVLGFWFPHITKGLEHKQRVGDCHPQKIPAEPQLIRKGQMGSLDIPGQVQVHLGRSPARDFFTGITFLSAK